MTLHLSIPAVAAAVGALVYGFVPGKLSTLGLVTYGAGMLAFLMAVK